MTYQNSNTIKNFNYNSVFRTECGHSSPLLTFDSSSPYISFSLFTRFILPLYTFHSSSSSYFILPLHTFHSSCSSPHVSFFLSTHFILPLHSLFFHLLFLCHLSFTQKSETVSFTQSFVCVLHSPVLEFHSPFFLPFLPSIRLNFLHSGTFLSLSLFSSRCLQHWSVSPPLVQQIGSLIRSTHNALMVNYQGLPCPNYTRKHTPLASIKESMSCKH